MRALLLLAAALAYAALRYVVLGETALAQLPLFVFNKALALTAVLSMALATLSKDQEGARSWRRCFIYCALLHTLCTLVLLSPAYYDKLYQGGQLSALASLGLLSGAAAVTLLVFNRLFTPLPLGRAQITTLIATAMCAHLLCIGAPGWLRPGDWPGGLPPMTLLGFGASLVALLTSLHRSRAERSSSS